MIVRPLALFLPKQAPPRGTARRRGASARRAILWGVAVAVLAHAGLAVALETVLPQLRDPEYGYRLVRAREQQRRHPDRPFVLVLGTSRTANGFDPTAAGLPNEPGAPLLFNCGLVGSSPVQMRSCLARLRADGVTPDVVLVELFFLSLTTDVSADFLCAPNAAKLTAADLRRLEPQLDDPAALWRAWRAARLDPWQAQRLVIASHLAPDLLPWSQRIDHYWNNIDQFGFDAFPLLKADEARPQRFEATRKAYEQKARTGLVSGSADRSVRALVAECRGAGIPVAFFVTPESPAFRSWYTPESRAALAAYTRVLTDELGCPVFLPPDDFAEHDFADGHHMLPHAAARFTRHLTDTHLKPWLGAERRK